VTAVEVELESSRMGFISDVAILRATYSPDAGDHLPQRLFLKRTKPELHPEYRQAGEHEVRFYSQVAPAAHDLPVPACYYASWDAATSHATLLLPDLSASHFQRPLPIPPGRQQGEQIVESLAQVHAHWWSHPELGKSIGAPLDPAAAAASEARLQASYPAFLTYLGDSLLPAQRAAYERILASSFLQRRAERLLAQRTLTLIHGDAHTNNVMLPAAAQGRAMLIDWQRWAIDVPLYDLAFLIALHWTAERRAALERPLVQHYHEHLIDRGVTGYSWADCWDDYRGCVTVMTLIPIGQQRRGMPAGVVWHGMEQSVAAFNELGCAELL
jgi:aminoglycoside phosphotransferase (APT) family kinase protein